MQQVTTRCVLDCMARLTRSHGRVDYVLLIDESITCVDRAAFDATYYRRRSVPRMCMNGGGMHA